MWPGAFATTIHTPHQPHGKALRALPRGSSPEWLAAGGDLTKPVDHENHNPVAFEACQDCLMGGVQAVKADVEDEIPEHVEDKVEDPKPAENQDAPPVDPWSQDSSDSHKEPDP
jgi:hypothetical protein